MVTNKFPSDETGLLVQVFYAKDVEPFIVGVNGGINDTALDEIHAEFEQYGYAKLFSKGDGDYLFTANYFLK